MSVMGSSWLIRWESTYYRTALLSNNPSTFGIAKIRSFLEILHQVGAENVC